MDKKISEENGCEADNLKRLGDYSFLYGFLLILSGIALMGLMVIVRIPIDGMFGVVATERYLSKFVAALIYLLAGCAFFANREVGRRGLSPSIFKLMLVGAVFLALGHDYGDVTPQLLSALSWLGKDCGFMCQPAAIASSL